jgi:hypothetical protein
MMSASLLDRHVGFWTRIPVDRPLVARLPPRAWEARPYPIRRGRALYDPSPLGPADVEVDRLLGLDKPLPQYVTGDLYNPLGCAYPEAWMEAVAGCTIIASAFGCVTKPVAADVQQAARSFSPEVALQSAWLRVMSAVLQRADEVAVVDGRAVRQLHLRGVIDVLAAYLGEQRLCQAMYDSPQAIEALAGKLTDLHVAVAQRDLKERRSWRGGYVSCWRVYAPGPLLDYQIDASSLFSPSMYAKHFLAFDRKILSSFPYSVLHLHACGLQHLDTLLSAPEVQAVEINLDRDSGAWQKERILASCQSVQEHGKSLIVYGELDERELDEFLKALSNDGLAIVAFEKPANWPADTVCP